MGHRFALAIDLKWLREDPANQKRLEQGLLPLRPGLPQLQVARAGYVRLRRPGGRVEVHEATVANVKDRLYFKSRPLCDSLTALPSGGTTLLLFFECGANAIRCIGTLAPKELWEVMTTLDPPLRPAAFDLPPTSATLVETEEIYSPMFELLAGGDPELFGTNAQQFLNTPHIIVPLFAHILSLASGDTVDFPLLLRKIAEQLRSLLLDASLGPVRIRKIRRDHAAVWQEMLGERIAFVDGGVARISGVPTTEPLAIRVGIYSVIPGESDLAVREDWELSPFVMGNLLERPGAGQERPDPKRLQEASRYVVESLALLRYIERRRDIKFCFLHGPLVNQFTQYDEGEPSYLPCIDRSFLASFGFTEERVRSAIEGIPSTALRVPLWNQFMAVYGAIMKRVFDSDVPIAGVVERTAGTWLIAATLDQLESEGRLTQAHAKRILDIVERYEISDDFLFGCVLEEGEYLEPVRIVKNAERRARDHWKQVVRQYPPPFATVLKTSADNFPYRIELNTAAARVSEQALRLLYHTSRLLPGYAFPVGLDIVDRYAKVPDWLARGVSARITAEVLRRALKTGDPNIVVQVRQFLARTPRDFFYRPPL